MIEQFEPARYLGVDLQMGPGVDEVCNAERLGERFAPRSIDTVICTEVLEHVRDWRRVVDNLKDVLVVDGTLFITTRSLGFPLHEYPGDYWRYELEDMWQIFGDMEVAVLISDPEQPGVFLKARKVSNRPRVDLGAIQLHSVHLQRRAWLPPPLSVYAPRPGRTKLPSF